MKHTRRTSGGLKAALILVGFFCYQLLFTVEPVLAVVFTHGVASGDVTSSSAVLWTRIDQEAALEVEVSIDPTFEQVIVQQTVSVSAASDFTAQIVVSSLRPDQTYFYRWRRESSLSEVGTFKTAPLLFIPANIRFAYSGDSDGTRVNGVPFFNRFEVLDAASLEGLDFFVYFGDTIYSDSELRPDGPALTLEEYRDAYKVNRDIAALRNLLADTSVYVTWDDHEVRNNFDGQTVDPTRYTNGRQAFLAYMPIQVRDLPPDPACAGTPLFRVFHWGKDVDIIVLDERSCRSGDVEAVCQEDLVPTLPPGLRRILAQQLDVPIPTEPPPGCLEAIFDPARTLLGSIQKQRFKAALLGSPAKFKFVINQVPIQQLYALPYDRWEGYGAERTEILNFIRNHRIQNVIFLTTDIHANLINDVFIDRFRNPLPIAHEFITGPIATFPFGQELPRVAEDLGLDPEIAVRGFHILLDIVGMDCHHLDAFSYGLVDVNVGVGTATITLKDDTGSVLRDQARGIPCTKTFGP